MGTRDRIESWRQRWRADAFEGLAWGVREVDQRVGPAGGEASDLDGWVNKGAWNDVNCSSGRTNSSYEVVRSFIRSRQTCGLCTSVGTRREVRI